jgi:hypothetical protein
MLKNVQFKMLVIPLTVFSQIILERPAILEGMTWLLEAQTFASSQNHVDLLLAMGESQVLSASVHSCLVAISYALAATPQTL